MLTPFVEGEKLGLLAGQFGAEPDLLVVHREVDGAPAVPEEVFPRVSGVAILLYRVRGGLLGEAVFELHRRNGEAVDEDGQVQGQLLVVVAVAQLAGYGEPVEPVEFCSLGVPRGRRPVEEGDAVLLVLDSLSQDVNYAPAVYLAL